MTQQTHRRLRIVLLVLGQSLPVVRHPLGGVGNTRLDQGSDDVDESGNLHAADHQRTHILILVNGAQAIENPDHEDHSDAVYP